MESCQEEKDKCYFMYGHYKSDTNELFYIGIGRKGAFHSQIYARAYQCSSWSRNYLWLRCFNKHGRIIDNSGCLCNISGGGEGRYRDKSNNKKIYV